MICWALKSQGAAVLCERVIHLLSGTPKIVVNLNGVDYIDSGGFGILVGLFISAKKRGGELKLVSPNKRVKEVLRHTNLDTIFRVYGNTASCRGQCRIRSISA